MSAKVTIVVPVYKQRRDWFLKALDSFKNQTYDNVEIIVSGIVGDESMNVAKEYFPDIKVVDSRVPDPKRQINLAIKFSTGDYIFQAGSDDWFFPDCIERHVDVAEKKNSVLVYGDIDYCDENLGFAFTHEYPREFSFELLKQRQIMSDCSLVRKDVMWEFGLLDESLFKFAVWDLWLQIGKKYPHRIHHFGGVGFKYRRHDNALGRKGAWEEYRDDFYKKWGIDYRYKTLEPAIKAIIV